MSKLQIHYVPIDDLLAAHRNAKTHSKKQIRQISASINEFGFLNPVLCDRDNRMVAGHGRVEAARLSGLTTIPVIFLHDLTPEQLRLFAIAENKLNQLGGFSDEVLKLEFGELADLEVSYDLTVTGFETAEIDLILADEPLDDAADDLASTPHPSNLSSGERVLLQFAISSYQHDDGMTNINRPKLLLLDELDAPLHPEMVHRWLRAISEGLVAGQGIHCILTTHSPTTVALAPEDALYEMREGQSGLTKVSKQDALNKLTFGVPTLSIDYSGRRCARPLVQVPGNRHGRSRR
ncbi:MAG: ParB N-terminal domain-containing protein [Sphingomonas sp.]